MVVRSRILDVNAVGLMRTYRDEMEFILFTKHFLSIK